MKATTQRDLAVCVLVGAALLLSTALGGCAKPSDQTSSALTPGQPNFTLPRTALGNLPAATKAVSQQTGDAKLLSVQMAAERTPTGNPKWVYTFVSPSKSARYLVLTDLGKVLGFAGGETTLTADEIAKIPDTSAWKIDSKDAFDKANAATGRLPISHYIMGMETYKAKDDTSTVQPFVWRVHLTPDQSGAASITVDVNAMTGDTLVRKP